MAVNETGGSLACQQTVSLDPLSISGWRSRFCLKEDVGQASCLVSKDSWRSYDRVYVKTQHAPMLSQWHRVLACGLHELTRWHAHHVAQGDINLWHGNLGLSHAYAGTRSDHTQPFILGFSALVEPVQLTAVVNVTNNS